MYAFANGLGNVGADIPVVTEQVPDETGLDKGQIGFSEKTDGLNTRQPEIDVGELPFIFIISDGTYASEDGAGADLVGNIDGKAFISLDHHSWLMLITGFDEFEAFLQCKQRFFFSVHTNRHDEIVEEVEPPFNDGGMPQCEGVESARKQRCSHGRQDKSMTRFSMINCCRSDVFLPM